MRLTIPAAFVLAGAIALISPVAFAQYTGPSSVPSYDSVAAILKNPVDDVHVVLDGHIVRKIGKEKYIFSDGTGEIRVEIDRKYLPATPIDEKVKVQIRGEVDKDLMRSPEIDVKQVTVVGNG